MAILAFAMTACTAISTATTTTTTVSGLREQLGMQFATTPYAGPVDEMCAASAAALVRDRYFGGTGP